MPAHGSHPNIVFVLVDTARADHFSSYGYHRNTTPFLDSIAEQGTRYERAFSNSIYSLPSYGSIFTGDYPSEHKAVDWNKKIKHNHLIEGLNERGYETYAVSTHLISGQFGLAEEFDEVRTQFVGSRDLPFPDDPVTEKMREYAQENDSGSQLGNFAKLMAKEPSLKSLINGGYHFVRGIKRKKGYWEDDGAAEALSTAESAIRSASDPFFLFLNFVETHSPYRPPKKYIRKFMPGDVSFSEIKDALTYSSDRASLNQQSISDRQREILIALYDAELRYLDDSIKKFYDKLTQQNIVENTLFIIASDHGDFFGEKGLWGHQGKVYNGACHIPLIIKYPWETTKIENGIVELRQLCPHIHKIADRKQTHITPSSEAIIEYYGLDTQLSYTPSDRYRNVSSDDWEVYQCAIIDREYKLIWSAAGEVELYDIESDFGESTDLSSDLPAVVDKYKSKVVDLVGDPAKNNRIYRDQMGKNTSDMDDEVEERLRELGYM